MKDYKKKFFLFTSITLIVVLIVSFFALNENRKNIQIIKEINYLYGVLNKSVFSIHKTIITVKKTKESTQKNDIQPSLLHELKEQSLNLKHQINKLELWIDRNSATKEVRSIVRLIEKKELDQNLKEFLITTQEIYDSKPESIHDHMMNIEFLSFKAQDYFDQVIPKVSQELFKIQNKQLKDSKKIVFFLVFLCLFEIIYIAYFVFKPLFNLVQEQNLSLSKSYEELKLANQSKADFIANMSHEIRTPITSIVAYMDILKDRLTDQQSLKTVDAVTHSTRHLVHLIDDLLDLSLIETKKLHIEKSSFSLNKLVNESVSVVSPRIYEKGLEVRTNFHSNTNIHLFTDEKRLTQILLNLLNNSIKFTKKGFIEIKVNIIQNANKVKISVIDTGIGIKKADQFKIFNAFEQSDTSMQRKYGGAGLGLNISKKLAEELGGLLCLEYSNSKGTIFSLYHPLKCSGQIEENSHKENYNDLVQSPEVLKVLSQSTVLIVDDAVENLQLFSTLLSSFKINVISAKSGEEAVDAFNKNFQEIDVVLLDLQMPDMSGYEVIGLMRESSSNTKIVALTAHAQESEIIKTKSHGFNGHISKPVGKNKLAAEIYSQIQNV